MRIHLQLSPTDKIVPFDCYSKLAGTFHKWLGGKNIYHDDLSLYSMSWLYGGKIIKGKGLSYREKGAEWFISSPDTILINRVINGVWKDPDVFYGMKVDKVEMRIPRPFGTKETLLAQNPIFIKENINGEEKHYVYKHTQRTAHLMTQTLQNKILKSGLDIDPNISVQFDTNYEKAKERTIHYKKYVNNRSIEIKNKCSVCPVILEGSPEAITFAWDVGIGNSTGIGFGSLR